MKGERTEKVRESVYVTRVRRRIDEEIKGR